MVSLRKQLNGYTLVETLVSMVIIMTVFAVGMLIVVNVMKSDRQKDHLKAYLLVKEIYAETLNDQRFYNETLKSDNMTIEKVLIPYNESDILKVLCIRIIDQKGRILAERREIIISKY